LFLVRRYQSKNQHKAPSLAGALANASLPSVSPSGRLDPGLANENCFRKVLLHSEDCGEGSRLRTTEAFFPFDGKGAAGLIVRLLSQV
jgi:hypothetical protein